MGPLVRQSMTLWKNNSQAFEDPDAKPNQISEPRREADRETPGTPEQWCPPVPLGRQTTAA